MADTVVITLPDDTAAVLQPTLTDAIAAALVYSDSANAAATAAAASAASALNSKNIAQDAANSASTAASGAVAAVAPAMLAMANSGSPTMATRARLQRALKANGALQTVTDYVMNNYAADSDTSLEWTEAMHIPTGGLVYTMIKAAIPYNDTQATALWQSAFALTN